MRHELCLYFKDCFERYFLQMINHISTFDLFSMYLIKTVLLNKKSLKFLMGSFDLKKTSKEGWKNVTPESLCVNYYTGRRKKIRSFCQEPMGFTVLSAPSKNWQKFEF